jgi:DNA-directed RNA polymerase II subunit RPB9
MAGLRFCARCNNLLEAAEDARNHVLIFKCKTCNAEEQAESKLVYKNALKKKKETRLETVDPAVASDPTLPRTFAAHCAKCNNSEAVFFQQETAGRDSDMALIFLCVTCHHMWLN